jgi:hypothetical protein
MHTNELLYTKEVLQLEILLIFSFSFRREAMLEYKSASTDHGYFFKPYVRPISLCCPDMDFCCGSTQVKTLVHWLRLS